MITDRFIEPREFSEFRLTVGLLDIAGVGFRVGTWDGYESRQMSPAAALRWARELEDSEAGAELTPVIAGIRSAADKALLIGNKEPVGSA